MSHELEIINGKAQMFSVKKTPWHRLGTILENPPTSEEAIKEAGLDWEIIQKPIYFKEGEEFHAFHNRVANVRNVDNKPLSIVSNSYKPLQNKDAFGWFDSIVENGDATYETAGSLQGGRKIWVMAKLDEEMEIINGDTVRQYILLCNSHDGMTGVMIQNTPVRVVCENTLQMSLGTGSVNTLYHHENLERKMNAVKNLLGLAKEEFATKKEVFQTMVKHQVTESIIKNYVNHLIPDANEKATMRVKASIDKARGKIWELNDTGLGVDIKGVRGTMWGLYNAAVEYGEYYMAKKVRDMGNYQLFGMGAQFRKRAYEISVEMIN